MINFADNIIEKIEHAAVLYYRLILLIAPAGAGKTAALHEVHERTGAPILNINLELSRRMLELTERQRVLQLPNIFSEIVSEINSDVILFDNTEILFDIVLKQDPLRLLQGLARNKTIVSAWNGTVDEEHILYASPDHGEYKRYPVRDFLTVHPEQIL